MSQTTETSWGIRSNKVIKTYLTAFLIAVGISLALTSFFCFRCFSNWDMLWRSFLYNMGITIVLWQGNGRMVWWLDKKIDWLEAPLKRLILSVLGMLAVTIPAFLLFHAAYIDLLTDNTFWNSLKNYNYNWLLTPIIITTIISLFLHSLEFFKSWKTSIVEKEELKREHLASQYETLKNQVNPHFLFNSLNVLSTLVYKDANLADQFIKQMSLVYRHVLDTRDKELIALNEELKALEAFIFMLKIRFNEGFDISIDLPQKEHTLVAPLALQMLVENAVKHNIVARSKPLTIEVFEQGDYIFIKNNLQPKQQHIPSSGIGLENIKARYTYLANKEIVVAPTEAYFLVKLPMIKRSEVK